MSLNKIIVLFVIILILFAAVVSFQFSAKNGKNPTSTLIVNGNTFKVEIARTFAEQQLGLSGRNSLPQDQGMLFLFPKPDYYAFWMRNMKFSLDIIYINGDKVVTVIDSIQPPSTGVTNPPTVQPDQPSDKVLEINAGFSRKYNIKKGDTVKIQL